MELSELVPGSRIRVFSNSYDFGLDRPYTLKICHVTGENVPLVLLKLHMSEFTTIPLSSNRRKTFFHALKVLFFIVVGDKNAVNVGTEEFETT